MSAPYWVVQRRLICVSQLRIYALHETRMVMHGIFLKALRDTASITFTGEACYRCIVREYLE